MASWLKALVLNRTEGPTALDRLAALPPAGLLGGAILIFLALSLVAMSGESIVYDEAVHLPAGYVALTTSDFRMNPEHPPLAKSIAAVPLLFFSVGWPSQARIWREADEWDFGYQFLYQSGNDPDRLVFWSRLSMMLWPFLLLPAVYLVARDLFGTRGGLIALALTLFCPLLLAHGHLVTTDVPLAALLFLAAAAFREFGRRPDLRWAAYAGLLLGGALLVKHSAVLMVPALGLILAVAWVRSKNPEGGGTPVGHGRRAALTVVLFAVSFTVLWAGYGFRFRGSPDPTFEFPWTDSAEYLRRTLTGRCVGFARAYHLLPEAYLYGLTYVHQAAQVRDCYALGLHSSSGWWWYFPFAFLVKTPAASLILMSWGLWNSLRRFGENKAAESFLVVPLIFYWVVAIGSSMNIGLRHLMPAVPLMAVLAGGIDSAGPEPRRVLRDHGVLLLLLTAAVGCTLSVPHFLEYFNLPSKLVGQPHEMLVDSNLDWGQSLSRLKGYMDRRGIPSIKLAYFGNASPRHLQLKHQVLPSVNAYSRHEPEWPPARGWVPDEYVAISATLLQGVLMDGHRDFYRKSFGRLEPVDSIGGSILIYRVPRGWRGGVR